MRSSSEFVYNQDDTPSYMDLGDYDQQCHHCGCLFWYNEQLKGTHYTREAEYHLCCGGGQIYMPLMPDPPAFIQQLFKNNQFMEHIRAYNQMFAMTSFGAKIDHSVNKGQGTYVFKISGQIHHWIRSLFPKEGQHLRFLQLYVYDTRDELSNRMHHFGGLDEITLNPEIVKGLIHVLDKHNGLVRLFRTERDKFNAGDIPSFKIRLYNIGGVHGYELPTTDVLVAIVFENRPRSRTDFDCRLDFICINQNDLWSDFLSGFYDAVSIGDREGIATGSKIMLPKILDLVQDPKGYKLVTELMMHGPCGAANLGASCMQNGPCNKHFPKQYNEKTYFDSNGHMQYRRRDTGVYVMKGESKLDNCNVVSYNRALCLAFEAHINIEYFDWSMLIKYLFKYISKGPDRILAKISNSEASTSVVGTTKKIDEIQNCWD
ncbi:hypothetical protein Tco_1290690 [Tanacetum coccineum]